MLRFWAKFAAFLGVLWLIVHFWPWGAIRHAPGVLAAAEPVQTDLAAMPLPSIEGYDIQAVALYDITSRILSTKRYWAGLGSDLVPIDVAVGWGRMSDQAVLDQFSISQGNRFFFYEWRNQPPIPREEIIAHAANMHLIAASPRVARAIRGLRAGQVATMRGYLVNVTKAGGFSWRTSPTRTDTGKGACELFYVEEVSEVAVAL